MQSAVIKHENNLKNIYSESRVANFDDYVKKKDRFRHTLLHWHQIPRANNPNKPLQSKAVNLLALIFHKLRKSEIVTLNHNYLSRITLCEKDQNVNILRQLDNLLDIVFYSKITINGQIFRNCYVIKHTETGREIIQNSEILLKKKHFVGKIAANPIKQTLAEDQKEAPSTEFIPHLYIYKEEAFKKDRSNTQVRESNFVNFNQVKDKIETAELGETKKMVSGGYSANTELQADTVEQVASVIKLKSRNKHLTNRRKTRTNAELKKYKAAKVIRDGFLGKGKYLSEMQEYLTDELCQILRDKSGREFDNRAIKEITKGVAAKTQEKEAFFNHINGFTAYLAMILRHEKRQAYQTNTEGFYTLAGISEETKQIQKRENYLDKIERYEGREPESCFKRRISGCLDPSKAYEFLTAMRYGNIENDVLTICLRKPVELTDYEKETILLQGALTYADPNDRDPEGKSIKFVVSQAYNQIEQVLIEENIKIPEGVWGKIVSCFINYYGKDAYINWISKLLVTENDKLVELTTNSEMVKDRIMSEYWAFLEEVSDAYDGGVVLR